ncbi:MAG: ABC transporter ATP-binding protein [Rhizobiaceae bacterium]|nr:MAG: ABC transporter ATP-binding protein [Rhizobiaceae bacterium]CAG0949195.1 Sulfate/thiosulfate import ATP-binding protein CysA [Rhizobiaceae bacterium]
MTLFEVRNLGRSFGGIQAVRDVSLSVAEGEIFSIIGPNGAGKTTLFNLVSRLYDADSGQIVFAGRDITRLAPHRVVELGIARTFQNIELFENSSVLHNLLVGRHCRASTGFLSELLFTQANRRVEIEHREKVEGIIELLDLQAHRNAPVGGLAYGIRKVVELGRALAAEPRLILLDEPSSGLNAEETEDLAFWIQDIRDDLGITVMMIEHDMGLVNMVSNRVLALDRGQVLAVGKPAEIMENPRVINAYLGG